MIITVVLAKIFEDDLVSFTVDKLEQRLDAPISVEKVSVIPLFSFPRLSAEIDKLYIGDPESPSDDTLLYINSLKVGLDTWDLIDGAITIDEMEISGLDFDYLVDSTGKSNIDFILDAFASDSEEESPIDTTSAPLDLSADKFTLKNIRVRYYDSYNVVGAQVVIPELNLKAKTKNNVYRGKTDGSVVLSNCFFKDTKINQIKSCTIDFNLSLEDKHATIKDLSVISDGLYLNIEGGFSYGDTLSANTEIIAKDIDLDILKKYMPDGFIEFTGTRKLPVMELLNIVINAEYINNSLVVDSFVLRSDGLDVGVTGNVVLDDTITIHTKIEPLTLNLDILKKYIPAKYSDEYGIRNIGGDMNFTALINGKLADSTLLPDVDVTANFNRVSVKVDDYPQIDAVNLSAVISNGSKPDLSMANVKITNAEIFTANSSIQLDGNIKGGLQNSLYQLNSKMNINLEDFTSIIPDSLAHNVKGNVIASVSTIGVLPEVFDDRFIDNVLDKTYVTMNIRNSGATLTDSLVIDDFDADITYLPQNSGEKEVSIDSLTFSSPMLNLNIKNTSLSAIVSGKISDVDKMNVYMPSFHIQNGSSMITGNADIKNFGSPEYNVNTTVTLALNELSSFVPDSLISNMTGIAEAKIKSFGKVNLDSLDTQLMPLLFENSSFDLSFNNISFGMPAKAMDLDMIAGDGAFKDNMLTVDSLNARVSLNNDLMNINHFTTMFNGVSMGLDTTIVKNIYSAVLLNQHKELFVNTKIHIGDIFYEDYESLVNALTEDSSPDDNTFTVSKTDTITSNTSEPTNWTFLFHGSASVKSIIIDSTSISGININRLHINDLSTLFKISDSAYIIDQFKFKAFEGEMNNSFYYKIRDDGTESVSTHNIIKNMNVRTMLKDMDNFGMDSVIRWENISGLFSTDLNTFIPMDDTIRIDKMMVSGDIVLEKGGVYDYAPAREMSKFTGIKELDNIQFKTLRSNIFMYKNSLYVPRTEIVSNALDIAAFGMYDMGGDCEYHLEIHLGNILFGKSNRRNKKQDKSGDEVDKKARINISRKIIYSIEGDKVKIDLDSNKSRKDMQLKITLQNKMLNFIFFPKNIYYDTKLGE